jgi:hypothetical protein
MLDRRSFLAALGAALSAPVPSAMAAGPLRERPLYLSACRDPDDPDQAAVAAFSGDGELLFATRLPSRGHDAVARPGTDEVVVFARRPGNWAAIVDLASGTVGRVVTAPPERHFFGHGAFSADGRLLYATENRIASGQGALGIYDAAAGYRRVDERPTFGIGPHDLAFLPQGDQIVVANGGTRTHPATGRDILNPESMEPSLSLVDARSGAVLRRIELAASLKGLSIRHLAIAADGEVVFGCQWLGEPLDGPLLVGIMDRGGRTRFLDMPEDALPALNNYIGSVALSQGDRIVAATSPKGGAVAFWDRISGRYLGRKTMRDVCGVAQAPPRRDAEGMGFLISSGHGGVSWTAANGPPGLPAPIGSAALRRMSWDNHLLRL